MTSESAHVFYDPNVEPIISSKQYLDEDEFFIKPRQVWVEKLNSIQEIKLGLVSLHPEIFGAQTRIETIHANVKWQRLYRFVSCAHTKIRSEVRGAGRKPHPQIGTGQAHVGSIRSPLWQKGGIVHSPRSPTPHYYMLPSYTRILCLASVLPVKVAQNDLHPVKDLEIPMDDRSHMKQLEEERKWGRSVLFVDSSDVMPQNISIATEFIKHYNLMPAYGLNFCSMLKHNTLVLIEAAARVIEEKISYHMNRIDSATAINRYS